MSYNDPYGQPGGGQPGGGQPGGGQPGGAQPGWSEQPQQQPQPQGWGQQQQPQQQGWGQQPGTPPGYGGGYGGPVSTFGRPLSEWWKRVVAAIIDGLVLAIPIGILYAIATAVLIGGSSQLQTDPTTGEITGGGGVFAAGIGTFFAVYAVALIVPFVYQSVLNGGAKGQTVGKKVMKLQVRDSATGGPIGVGKGFLRTLVAFALSSFTCGIGGLLDVLWPLWDPQRQTLHDKVVTSVVVDV